MTEREELAKWLDRFARDHGEGVRLRRIATLLRQGLSEEEIVDILVAYPTDMVHEQARAILARLEGK